MLEQQSLFDDSNCQRSAGRMGLSRHLRIYTNTRLFDGLNAFMQSTLLYHEYLKAPVDLRSAAEFHLSSKYKFFCSLFS